VKGTAIAQPIRFKIVAGMQSGPVAFDSSNSLRNFAVYLERKATNSSNSESGLPKKKNNLRVRQAAQPWLQRF